MVTRSVTRSTTRSVSLDDTFSGGVVPQFGDYLSECTGVTTPSQALLLGYPSDIGGTTVKDYLGNYPATLIDSHCLTLSTSDTITIDKLPSGTTVDSNDGSATFSISGEVLTCTSGGTVYGLTLSNGSYFPCAEGAGSSIIDTVNNFRGVLSANDWSATQDDLAYNANYSFGLEVTDWGDFNGPIQGPIIDSSGGSIEFEFVHRANTSGAQYPFGSFSGGRFDMAINTNGELSFVFKATPFAFGGIQLEDLKPYAIRLEWTATVVELFVNGVSQGTVTKNTGSIPSTAIWLGNRQDSTTSRFRGQVSRFDVYDSNGELDYTTAHQTGTIKHPTRTTKQRLVLIPAFGQSLLLGTGTLSESTYFPKNSFFATAPHRLIAAIDPNEYYSDGGGAGSIWPRFQTVIEQAGYTSASINLAVSATPVVPLGDSNHWSPGGTYFNRFVTQLYECIVALTARGYDVHIPMIVVWNGQAESTQLQAGNISAGDYETYMQNAMDDIRGRDGFGDIRFGFLLNGQRDPAINGADINDFTQAIWEEQESLIADNSYCILLDDSGKTAFDDGLLADHVHYTQAGYESAALTAGNAFVSHLQANPNAGFLNANSFRYAANGGHHNFESVIDFHPSAPTQANYSYGDLRACPNYKIRAASGVAETNFFSGT